MENQQYAISKYPDVDEVYRRLDALISQPMRPIRREKMQEVSGLFREKMCAIQRTERRSQTIIPGGVQHNLAFNYPFPIAIEKADGAHLVGCGRQPLYRFPAGRRTDRAGQQLRTGARQSDRNAANLRSGDRSVP